MRSSLLAILIVTTPAVAAPSKPKPLEPALQKKYDVQLKQGRALQGKKQYKEAIAALQAALVVAPDDSTALAELGWTAYLAKDLALAEASTRKALAGQAAPNIRGAALYNLGLIEEAKGDKPAAIVAYASSLVVRPNGVVRKTLAKLAPDAAAAFDPFKPIAMAGPFPSIEAYCKTTPKTTADEFTCDCETTETRAVKRAAPAGMQLEMITHACHAHASENGETNYKIGVKVASGWYVAPIVTVQENRFCNNEVKLAEVASAGKVALVKLAMTGGCAGANGGQAWSEQAVIAIGGVKPAATPSITMKRHETESDEPYDADKVSRTPVDIALDFAWGGDGSVTVSGKTKGLDAGEATNVLGKHALAFP